MAHLVWIAPFILLLVAACWGIYLALNDHAQSQRTKLNEKIEMNYQSLTNENYLLLAERTIFRANRSYGTYLKNQRWIRNSNGEMKLYKAMACAGNVESSLIDVTDDEARRWLRWKPRLFLAVFGRKPTWKDDWKSSGRLIEPDQKASKK
jgi:hypothetical protein